LGFMFLGIQLDVIFFGMLKERCAEKLLGSHLDKMVSGDDVLG
jgi:hypothetical protein